MWYLSNKKRKSFYIQRNQMSSFIKKLSKYEWLFEKNNTLFHAIDSNKNTKNCCTNLTFYFATLEEWVSRVTRTTATTRIVIDYLTSGIYTAFSYAWIYALFVFTCLILRAFWTNNTLWTTIWWRSNVSLLTGANCMTVFFTAYTIRATWRWVTGVCDWDY